MPVHTIITIQTCCSIIHVTVNLLLGMTQRSMIESCITNVSFSSQEKNRGSMFVYLRIEAVRKERRRLRL